MSPGDETRVPAPGEHRGESGIPAPREHRGDDGAVLSRAQSIEILEGEIRELRRKKTRHSVFALAGLSPVALLPMIGLAADYGAEVALVLSVFVMGWEGWKAVQAGADIREAESEMRQLRDPPDSLSPPED